MCAAQAILCGGCQSAGVQGRERDQQATFSVRSLRTELPPEVEIAAVAAAGEAMFRARGYSIREKSVTRTEACLIGNTPKDGWLDQTVFRAYVTPGGTGMTIRIDPWGDEATSRTLMDDVLARLGR